MVRRYGSADVALQGGTMVVAPRRGRWLAFASLLAVGVLALESVVHGSIILSAPMLIVALTIGCIASWVVETERRARGSASAARLSTPLSRDALTLGGLVQWGVGIVVGLFAGWDDPAQGLASVTALGGLSVWTAGILRSSVRYRASGQSGVLTSRPVIAVVATATVVAILTLAITISIWVGR